MAENESNLALQMDKISYALAAIIGVGVLVAAGMSGGALADLKRDIADAKEAVDELRSKAAPETKIPNIERELKKQWPDEVQLKSKAPGWSVEPIPAVVYWEVGPSTGFAQHAPFVIEKIKCLRSKASFRPLVIVQAKVGELVHVVLESLQLLRSVDGEEFVPVKGFQKSKAHKKAKATGKLKYVDKRVKAGKTYAYKIVSTVKLSSDSPDHIQLQDENKEKTSAECSLSESVPFDYSIRLFMAKPFDGQTGDAGFFLGQVQVGSGKPGAEPRIISSQGQRFEEQFEFGPKLARGKPIFVVEPIPKDNQVIIRNRITNRKEKLTPKVKPRSLVLPLPVEDCTSQASRSEEGEEGEEPIEGEGDGVPRGPGNEPSTPRGPGNEPSTPRGPGNEPATPRGPGNEPEPGDEEEKPKPKRKKGGFR